MDRDSTKLTYAETRLRLKNLAAGVAVVVLAAAVYGLMPYNQRQLGTVHGWLSYSFTGRQFLVAAASTYALALAAYHLGERAPGISKSLRALRVLAEFVRSPAARLRRGLAVEDRVAVLATLLKAFYAPLMALSLMGFCMGALAHGSAIATSGAFGVGVRTLFDRHGYWFLMQLFLFIDVLVFTVGYLVETRRFGSQIRSVDPTLLGWTAALLCYPPFNQVSWMLLGSQVSDFPQFQDPTVHVALNLVLLGLMATYAWTSASLGFKASNLTHRGIVTRGPYALVRHPAYVCKNLAWWIASIPLVSAAFGQSLFDGIQAVASVVGWTMLYVLRALTEEDHLRSVDGDYASYATKVRFRFLPGVA